jgi:hypothetical protein
MKISRNLEALTNYLRLIAKQVLVSYEENIVVTRLGLEPMIHELRGKHVNH